MSCYCRALIDLCCFIFLCFVQNGTPLLLVPWSTTRLLDHCFRSFRSLFESISIDYKTLEHCHRAHKLHKYWYTSYMCTLQVRFLLSPFPIVSVAVWITVFACFDLYLNLFQSITKHCSTGAKLFCIWNIFYLLPFSHPWVALKWSLIVLERADKISDCEGQG